MRWLCSRSRRSRTASTEAHPLSLDCAKLARQRAHANEVDARGLGHNFPDNQPYVGLIGTTEENVIDEVVVATVVALFDAYDVEVKAQPDFREPAKEVPRLAGIIGFTSAQLRGSIVLCSSVVAVEATGQTAAGDISAIRDWMGELANQLLGRIKLKLLRYGIVLNLSTPVVVSGIEMSVHEACPDGLKIYHFDHSGGPLTVMMDVSFAEEFEFRATTDAEEAPSEGEVVMF